MKKFLVSTLALAGLLGTAAVSHAQVVTYQFLVGTTQWTQPGIGVSPNGGNDPALTNFLGEPTVDPQVLRAPSVVKFGNDITSTGSGLANTSGVFTAVPVTFEFKVDVGNTIGATAHTYLATGAINGAVGYDAGGNPFSTAHLNYTSIMDETTGLLSTIGTDPNNGVTAVKITSLINGVNVNLFLDTPGSKPVPGDASGLTQAGFVTTAVVPEPGSMALLLGLGVSGSGFLLLRRRRA